MRTLPIIGCFLCLGCANVAPWLADASIEQVAVASEDSWSRQVDTRSRLFNETFVSVDTTLETASQVVRPGGAAAAPVFNSFHSPAPDEGDVVAGIDGPVDVQGNIVDPPHKRLWPLNVQEVVALLVVALGLMIAACGGIGGGGFLVPIYIMVMRHTTKKAVGLSNVTIFGGSIANAAFNMGKRNAKGLPLIDWDIILMMEPSTIAGALLGSFLSKTIPAVVQTSLLAVLLAFMGWDTLRKGIKRHKQETAPSSSAQVVPNGCDTPNGSIIPGSGVSLPVLDEALLRRALDHQSATNGSFQSATNGELPPTQAASAAQSGQDSSAMSDCSEISLNSELPAIDGDHTAVLPEAWSSDLAAPEAPVTPTRKRWSKPISFVPLYLGCLALTVLRGGGLVECGRFWWWMLSLTVLPFCVLFFWYYRKTLLANPEESSISWDERNTVIYPAISTLAGLFAGLFGVGGGIVKGPLMLAIGVEPKVASATAATMIFFTSSTACVSYAFFGELILDYSVFLFFLGMISTALGQMVVSRIVGTRQAPIVFSIAAVILISSAALIIESVTKGIAGVQENTIWDISSLCPK